MYVILFKLREENAKTFGPYETYGEAEDELCTLPAAKFCDYKYIDECLVVDDDDKAGADRVGTRDEQREQVAS